MTPRRGIVIGGALFIAIAVGGALLTVSPAVPAQTILPLPVVNNVTVLTYTLIGERRISRTASDFTYRVNVRNTGPALIVVSGTVSSTSTAVTFPDSAVSFGDIASGTPATSTDTFRIRQNRTQRFSRNQLVWQFRAAPGEGIPPDPGPANDLTIAGIDSDSDGVRDDVERWIAYSQPSSARRRAALIQFATGFGNALTSSTSRVDAVATSRSLGNALACLQASAAGQDPDVWYYGAKEIEAQYFNTRGALARIS